VAAQVLSEVDAVAIWKKLIVTVNQQVNHISTSADRAEEIRQVIDGETRRLK
jgi:hypothetical protein